MTRYYAQPADSVRHLYGVSLENTKDIAKEWSREVAGVVAVYKDTGTGFDPVIAKFQRGKKVFDQEKRVEPSLSDRAAAERAERKRRRYGGVKPYGKRDV